MTPTDDKRIEEIRARYAVTRGAHASDIAFLLGKIAEYEARDGAVKFGPGDYSCATCGMGMVEPCEHWKAVLLEAPAAAPPPQVLEAESVERPQPGTLEAVVEGMFRIAEKHHCGSNSSAKHALTQIDERLTELESVERLDCGHLKAEWQSLLSNPKHRYDAGSCRACDRERTAREEGFKAGLKAAAEKRCRFCDDGVVIVSGEHVNSSGNGIPCGAQDILAIPVQKIASEK
jgi:hypothetical protein